MQTNIDRVVEIIKKQVEMFLLDAGEFYPFGTCIDKFDNVIPVGAYSEAERPLSDELIRLLEKDFTQGVYSGDYQVAAIAIDIVIRKGNDQYDGIELRFFWAGDKTCKKYFKYLIKETVVEFVDYRECHGREFRQNN